MYTIKRRIGFQVGDKRRSREVVCEVFTEEEAKQRGVVYAHWRIAKVGEWALTDDAHVAQVLRRSPLSDEGKTLDEVALTCARAINKPKAQMLFLTRLETRDWTGLRPQRWAERKSRATRYKLGAKLLAHQMLAGSVDWQKVGETLQPTHVNPVRYAQKVYRQEEFRSMVDSELSAELAKRNITKGSVLDMILKAAELSENGQDPGNLLKAAAMLAPLVGAEKDETHIQTAEFQISEQLEKSLLQAQSGGTPPVTEASYEVL